MAYTIAGTTDFVTLGSGDDTGLSFGALEFAIIGETQEAWATRTGFTIV